MKIRIIGTESLGVRGLSCVVEAGDRKIFIDPGIALGYLRKGLMPHPVQVGVGRIIRERILGELKDSTDVVLSHFHGDHVPLCDANPYQLSIDRVREVLPDCIIWANRCDGSNEKMKKREEGIILGLEKSIREAEGRVDGSLSFLEPAPHGEKGSRHGNVTITRIEDEKSVFVHASDIQLLEEETVDEILESGPDIVMASGPPLYLEDYMRGKTQKAWDNALKLARGVGTLIIDHHLLRCGEGLKWIERLSKESGNRVVCAAQFMDFGIHMLEARREMLYEDIPIERDWHDLYEKGLAGCDVYMDIAREKYDWFEY